MFSNIDYQNMIMKGYKITRKQYLSAGHYSKVYGNNLKAVKIFVPDRENYDPCYYYLKWSLEVPKPWKPRVYSLQGNCNGYVCVMPRYKEISHTDFYGDEVQDVISKAKKEIWSWLQKHPKLKKTGTDLDIHRCNVMWDNERVIITDPIADAS